MFLCDKNYSFTFFHETITLRCECYHVKLSCDDVKLTVWQISYPVLTMYPSFVERLSKQFNLTIQVIVAILDVIPNLSDDNNRRQFRKQFVKKKRKKKQEQTTVLFYLGNRNMEQLLKE